MICFYVQINFQVGGVFLKHTPDHEWHRRCVSGSWVGCFHKTQLSSILQNAPLKKKLHIFIKIA